MADTEKKILSRKNVEAKINNISDKSAVLVYGATEVLDKETERIKALVRDTVNQTSIKFGERTNGKTINYFNEINMSKAFSEILKNNERKEEFDKDPEKAFKKFMEEESSGFADAMMMNEGSRVLLYNNYAAIYNHIPECAQALDIYKHNIISADDFTKLIFNIKYDDETDSELKNAVEEDLKKISEKYGFEDLADKIINDTLLYGDEYVAVLSLEKEFGKMLEDPALAKNILNESNLSLLDPDSISQDLSPKDIKEINEDLNLAEIFLETYKPKEVNEEKNNKKVPETENSSLTEDQILLEVSRMINDNIKIGSKKEFLLERYLLEKENNEKNISAVDILEKRKPKKKYKRDEKPLFINGSCIRILDPSKVIELKVDNICFGYYVFEDDFSSQFQNQYGPSAGRELDGGKAQMNMNTIYSPSVNNTRFSPDISNFTSSGIGQAKMELITTVFLNSLSKKLNKDFIRKNKEFKDFLFQLVKQDYILKKGLKVTFLAPDEVIAFKVPAVFRKITLFAKLYLATLTNNMLINLGRAHDKRVFYVETGLDANYSNAINRVIQDVKTKEFKMSTLNDINTVLNLSPGRFDDYFIPTVNGNRPLEIDTLQGMNADMNNEFLEFLRKSMVSGTGVNMAMIDSTQDLDFSRQISSLNAQFVRSVITYQKKFTPPFNKFIRTIYKNETTFLDDKEENNTDRVVYDKIKVQFPSPATLAMSALTEQITVAEQNSESIASVLCPTNEEDRVLLKAAIMEDLLPSIDWNKYKEILEKDELKKKRESIKKPVNAEEESGNYGNF